MDTIPNLFPNLFPSYDIHPISSHSYPILDILVFKQASVFDHCSRKMQRSDGSWKIRLLTLQTRTENEASMGQFNMIQYVQ